MNPGEPRSGELSIELPPHVYRSGFVFERQRHPRAVFNDLAGIDLHVELADFGDTQITQRLGGSFHSICWRSRGGVCAIGDRDVDRVPRVGRV
jgi:hypothetical protein